MGRLNAPNTQEEGATRGWRGSRAGGDPEPIVDLLNRGDSVAETGQNLCAEILVVPDRSASRRSMPARRKSPTREPGNRRLKPIRRDRRRPIVCESAKPVTLRMSLRAKASPKYKRAAFSFVMRGLDPRIQGRRPRDNHQGAAWMPGSRLLEAGHEGRRFGRGASILRRFFFRRNQIRARVFFEVVRPLRSWSGRGLSSPVWSKLLNRGVSAAGIAGREDLTAKRSRPEMAPQRLEKIESAPGNGMVSEAWKPQHLVHGRAADRALRLRAARMTKSKESCRKRRPTL